MSVFQLLAVFVAFVISYIVRDTVYNYFMLSFIHILMCVGIFFVPGDIYIKVFAGLVPLGLLNGSVKYVFNNFKVKPMADLPYFEFLLAIAMYVLGVYMESSTVKNIAFIMPLILIILFLVLIYTDGLDTYVASTKDVTGIPLSKILTTNSIIVIGIFAFTVIAVLATNYINDDNILKQFVNFVMVSFRILVAVIGIFLTFLEMFISTGRIEEAAAAASEGTEKIHSAGNVANAMEFVLNIAVFAIIIFLAYSMIVRIVKFFLSRRRLEGDLIEELQADEVEVVNPKEKLIHRIISRFSTENRIRRMYKKKVLQYKDYYLPDDKATTRDILEKLEKEAGVDIAEITRSYEDVRYGE